MNLKEIYLRSFRNYEEVTMELTNGLSPIVLTPVDEKYDFAYMILPVRIKNS